MKGKEKDHLKEDNKRMFKMTKDSHEEKNGQ